MIDIVIFSPETLQAYAAQLIRGFDETANVSSITHLLMNSSTDDYLQRCGRHLESIVSDNRDKSQLMIVQWHGAEHEIPVVPLLLGASNPLSDVSSPTIVIIHRPEEIVLRYGKAKVCDLLSTASAVVLLGNCSVPEYQQMLPRKLVTSIPHGFFAVGSPSSASDGVLILGTTTAMGEMRHLEDVIHVTVGAHEAAETYGDLSVVGLVTAKLTPRAARELEQLQRHGWFNSRVVSCSAQELEDAYQSQQYIDISSFRTWIAKRYRGYVVICEPVTTVAVGNILKDSFDINVQLYHELLRYPADAVSPLFKPPEEQASTDNFTLTHTFQHQFYPKVEYAGSLHANGGPTVALVFDSPSMKDVELSEGLHVLFVEKDTSTGLPNFVKAGQECVEVIRTDKRSEMSVHNVQTAKTLDMKAVAQAYSELYSRLVRSSSSEISN
eukprot:GILK01011138.1.p1 GENE.GILK01011138.1~~GILK01011138.1.p1  ORF type:complete len:439 (+),score=73.45 GILK01011138.1:26-1342(+)